MQLLQVMSLLLDYPTEEIQQHRPQIETVIHQSALSESSRQALLHFVQQRLADELMEWQADYDSLFERGRSLSLLLFEHLHGESRDRGQAMVDLQGQYREAGLEISLKELPDYLPLYLEFLSTQGDENAQYGLQEVAPILALLAARTQQRQCDYQALFLALLELSGAEIDLSDIRQQIAGETRDDTAKELDKVWEEEMVSFMSAQSENSCPSSQYRPSEGQRRDQFIPLDTELLNASAPPRAAGV